MSEFDRFSSTYSDELARSLGGLASVDNALTSKLVLIDSLLGDVLSTPGSRVLDFGCGTGLLLQHLGGLCAGAFGLDVSLQSLKATRGLRTAQFDGKQIPLASNSLDCALAVCVFHHITDSKRADILTELGRVLNPQGKLVIIEHNPFNPLTRWVVGRCEFDRHAELLSPGQLQRLMMSAGFSTISRGHFFAVPPWTKWLSRADAMLARLPLGAQHYGMYTPATQTEY